MITTWKPTSANPFPETCDPVPEPATRYEWLLQRREGIGSSDAAAIMGLSNFESPYSLWLDKRGEVPIDVSGDNELQQWGHLLEPVIRQQAGERLGLEAKTCGALVSKDRPWQRCNLDGYFIAEDGIPILECKNTDARNADQWDEQIPDAAEIQVAHSMAVTGAPYAWVAGLIGGNRLALHRVERNPNIVDILIEEEAKFWQYVQSDTPPPADGHLRTLQTLTKGWAHKKPAKETDDPQVELWWRQWAEADEELKAAEDRKREAVANLAVLMDGHDELRSGDRVWAKAQLGQLDMARLAEEHPDLVAKFTTPAPTFDRDTFKAEQPDLYKTFQHTSIRPKKEKS